MTTIFDSAEFNQRLFFPRGDASPPPKDAIDRMIPVEEGGGAEVHVRAYSATAAPTTILFFHGNGEVVADYDDAASMFEKAGARLIVSDYRGYGKSTGTPTLRSTIDDASKVLDAVKDLISGRPLIIMGRSLGVACAIDLYARSSADAFIFESGASDLLALVARRGMRLSAEEMDEATRAKFDPLAKLPHGRAPLLVMHGARDEMISPREAERSFEVAGTESAKKKLVLIEGHGHNDISLARSYWSELAAFVSASQV